MADDRHHRVTVKDTFAKKAVNGGPPVSLCTLFACAISALLLGPLLMSAAAQNHIANQIDKLKVLDVANSVNSALDGWKINIAGLGKAFAASENDALDVAKNLGLPNNENKEEQSEQNNKAVNEITVVEDLTEKPIKSRVLRPPTVDWVKANLPRDFLFLPPIATRPLKPRAVFTSLLAHFDASIMNRHLLMAVELQAHLFSNTTSTLNSNSTEFVILLEAQTPSFIRRKLILLGARLLIVPSLTHLSPRITAPDARYTLLQLWKLEKVYESILYIDPSLVFLDQSPWDQVTKLWRLLDSKEGMQEGDAFYNPDMDFFAAVLAENDDSMDYKRKDSAKARNAIQPKPTTPTPNPNKRPPTAPKKVLENIKKKNLAVQNGLMLFTPKKAIFQKLVTYAAQNVDELGELPDGDSLEQQVIGKFYLSELPESVGEIPSRYNADPSILSKNALTNQVGFRQPFWMSGSTGAPPVQFESYAKSLQSLRAMQTTLYTQEPTDASLPFTPVVPTDFSTFLLLLQSTVWHQQIGIFSPKNTPEQELHGRTELASHLSQATHYVDEKDGALGDLEAVVDLLEANEWVWFLDSTIRVSGVKGSLPMHIEIGRIAQQSGKNVVVFSKCKMHVAVLIRQGAREKLGLVYRDLVDRNEFNGGVLEWGDVLEEYKGRFEEDVLGLDKTDLVECS
ncbi:UNVERIFIED_CONTAM: hypothetical protein HDU68_004515 [Siphonaria sp. JEL0065]|nr:hypothetical protein HDU68_004515 [Siphonaria sp. JEL0065]